MIKAVFFDFYNTLVRFWPPVEEVQARACEGMGLKVTREGLLKGYAQADRYFNRENALQPLSGRSPQEREAFFALYEQLILKGAGLEVSEQMAGKVWREVQKVPTQLALFDDVLPALVALKAQGLILGVISNIRREMPTLTQNLGLAPYLDFVVTSQEVGAEKPHAPIFLAALGRAKATPQEALHVGDQYESDVLGARNVGIRAALLDRNGTQDGATDCPRIGTLTELEGWLRRERLVT